MLAIRCDNLVKRYDGKPPVDAVRGLDLAVEQGECFGLLGPNGAGKTTTIEILEGLLDATSGEVEVLGFHWGRQDDEIRQRIGISLQETRLSEKLTVRETLTLFRSFYRRGIEPDEAMARVSLEEKANSWVGNLSGGQKQRLAVACALVGDPELLFLDEPTTGLDPQSRRQLWDIIRQFRDAGRTVLLTTHYMDEAERLCDRVAIVDHGQVIALGTPRELIASLGGEHVIEFTLETIRRQWPILAERFADLPTVSAARAENGHICLSVGEPHIVLPALLERLESLRLPADGPHHAARQPGRRVREIRRPAFDGRNDGTDKVVFYRIFRHECRLFIHCVATYWPLAQIVAGRLREFIREPEALFWVYGFPILMTIALGIAFRNQPVEQQYAVDVIESPKAAAARDALQKSEHADRFRVEIVPEDQAQRLRTGRTDLIAVPRGSINRLRIPLRSDAAASVLARNAVDDQLQRSSGRRDVAEISQVKVEEPGGRYIDFLVPGLFGMSLMGGGLWGVGFVTVDMRIRKLLKRFLATPMKKRHFWPAS